MWVPQNIVMDLNNNAMHVVIFRVFSLSIWGGFHIDSSKMICRFLEVLNFNRLLLQTQPVHMNYAVIALIDDSTPLLSDWCQTHNVYLWRFDVILLRATLHTRLRAPWPLHFKHSHWWNRRSRYKFASHHTWGTNGVCECRMDVKSAWITTWHQMDHVFMVNWTI